MDMSPQGFAPLSFTLGIGYLVLYNTYDDWSPRLRQRCARMYRSGLTFASHPGDAVAATFACIKSTVLQHRWTMFKILIVIAYCASLLVMHWAFAIL